MPRTRIETVSRKTSRRRDRQLTTMSVFADHSPEPRMSEKRASGIDTESPKHANE